jgi:hypothetical protein
LLQTNSSNRLIVHAAANAQRAVDSILGISFESAEDSEETIEEPSNLSTISRKNMRHKPRFRPSSRSLGIESVAAEQGSYSHSQDFWSSNVAVLHNRWSPPWLRLVA